MQTCLRLLISFGVGVAAGFAPALGAAAPAESQVERWVLDFQRFAAHPGSEDDDTALASIPAEPAVSLTVLLRALPPPPEWPRLRQTLAAARERVPADKKLERQRLQAAGWLLDYLLAGRNPIEADLAAAVSAAGETDVETRYRLRALQAALTGNNEQEASPARLLEQFERQIILLEPVDEAAVKRVLESEENFVRLKRLVAGVQAMQAKASAIYDDFEKTHDETAARTKSEALQKEYEEQTKADREALEKYLHEPLVEHYVNSVMREKTEEGATPEVATLYVPDLVAIAGQDRAVEWLHRALRVPAKLELVSNAGEATRKLVREQALAAIAAAEAPSWDLVSDAQSTVLFEAYRQRFPQVDPKDSHYRNACGFYIAGLIQQKRIDDAVKLAIELDAAGGDDSGFSLPYAEKEKLERGHPGELWQFLKGWLAKNPAADEWDAFNRLSVELDRQTELKEFIKSLAANGAFKGMSRLMVQRLQADAEFATHDIAPAQARLRAAMEVPAETTKERELQVEMALRLIKATDLESDQAGYASACRAAEALVESSRQKDKLDEALSRARHVAVTLNGLGRFVDGERVARTGLGWTAAMEKADAEKKGPDAEPTPLPDYILSELLAEQFRAEVELGHWPEAVALLQDNPWWDTGDVSGLVERSFSHEGRPLGYYAALVARHQNDPVRARHLLEAQLVATPGADSVYRAYLELAGPAAVALLDKLALADHYEERPLIWKARLQMDAKQWGAAIVTLQQAITIDPSDGEEGRGDRMRAYAWMSEAMAAKGDAEKSAFFANAVKAIRVAEMADRWSDLGDYAHAIELYREALGSFQDAYCVQSRLAIRLADAGKMEEAIEHYRRAFELMPDSFGRVESHCFGCERVFAGKKTQSVAEGVFARLLRAQPDKPQLHYLSGYLCEEQENFPAAAQHYRDAVRLDPLYLNAWNRLADLDSKLNFTFVQKDDLLVKLVELDPARRHVSPDLSKATDWSRLWQALRQANAVLADLPVPGKLGELKASAARLAQAKHPTVAALLAAQPERRDFAAVLGENNFVRQLGPYLASLNAGTNH